VLLRQSNPGIKEKLAAVATILMRTSPARGGSTEICSVSHGGGLFWDP
jgi:hypothetical protein